MAAAFAPVRWVKALMTPSKPGPQPAAPVTPTSEPRSPLMEQHRAAEIPKSLFSDRPSQYMTGRKRKFELDFDLREEAKKTKIDTSSNIKRKREDDFVTPQKRNKTQDLSQTLPPMPRSAMKRRIQPRTPATVIKKNVTFNQDPRTGTKTVRPYYGKAGDYRGCMFTEGPQTIFSSPEASPTTPSSISDISSLQSLSPTTKSNTNGNTPNARTPAFVDPNYPFWTPRPHNPRPGQFCLPDDMSIYDDEDESMIGGSFTPKSAVSTTGDTSTTPETIRKGYNAVFPNSPETPRLTNAQLPASVTQSTSAAISEYPTPPQHPHSTTAAGNLFAEADVDAVNKARAAAEKYKPASVGKQASKLSQVTQARSRSSSPPLTTPGTPAFAIDPALTASNKENSGAGNTDDNEYDQQYDDWARKLEWPQPGQKIVEDEIFKSAVMDDILKDWTAEDDEQSEAFWDREFDRVIDAGRRAEREGKVIMFV